MDLSNLYLLDDSALRERWWSALLLLAMAGVALLFVRSAVAKVVGCLLILARLVAMPMTGTEVAVLVSMALLGVVTMMLRDRDPEAAAARGVAETPEPDDAHDPAPCPACRGVIPAGRSRCPTCGWTYAAAEQPSIFDDQ